MQAGNALDQTKMADEPPAGGIRARLGKGRTWVGDVQARVAEIDPARPELESQLQRIAESIRAIADLKHPNVVTPHMDLFGVRVARLPEPVERGEVTRWLACPACFQAVDVDSYPDHYANALAQEISSVQIAAQKCKCGRPFIDHLEPDQECP